MRSALPRALIKVGYACNNNCVFCHSAPHRGVDSELDTLVGKLALARSLGAGSVVLSGGEPTLRRDLAAIARQTEALDLGLGLVTNGRMLVYRDLRQALLARGLNYVHLSLCGPDARIHDRHVRTKSFEQVLETAIELAETEVEFTINVVVTAWNLEHLDRIAPMLAGHGVRGRLKFSFIEPEGHALDRFSTLVPSVSGAGRQVARAVQDMASHPDLEPAVDGFPLCTVPELEGLDAGLRREGFFAMSEALENGFYPVDDRNRCHPPACLDCSLRRKCRGIYKTYIDQRGAAELEPVHRPVSNAFNLVPLADPESLDLVACPIRAGRRPPPDPVLGLLVQTGPSQVQRHLTNTTDFSDETLERAIGQQGQVYLDRLGRLLHTELGSELTKLGLADTCRGCPRKVNCPGVWQPAQGDPFADASGLLERLLEELTGRILDVGCGGAPYLAALEPGLRSGSVQYVGLDPNLPARPAEPGRTWFSEGLEDFNDPGSGFDAVVALRSVDHLPSPAAALAKMAGLLRAGGRMLLAEDVVFGVVRRQDQVQQIKQMDDPPFEHRFNLDLDDVVSLAEGNGLHPVEMHPTTETGCTLWVLVLEKDV